MRARRWRLLLVLTNLVAAILLVGIALWAFVIEPSRARPELPRHPLPFILPGGQAPLDELWQPVLEVSHPERLPEGPTAAEDRRALEDPQRDFESAYRVLFVALDPEDRSAHGCIVASRALGEQVFLAPGARLGDAYMLLGIDPLPGNPRGARLRFSDLHRGVVVEIRLSPAR